MSNIITNRSTIFSDSWEGIQGSEIRKAIQDALKDLENFLSGVANSIVSVDIEYTETTPNSFTLVATDATGGLHIKTITLKTVSTKLMNVDTTGTKLVIAYGLNLEIPYTLEITELGIKLPNITAEITILNNGNFLETITSVPTTSGTNKKGTIKIDLSNLVPGNNIISLQFKANTEDLLEKTITLSVNVINLKLSLTSTLNKLIDNEFSIPYSLSGAPNIEGYTTITLVYYFGTPISNNSTGYKSGDTLKFSDISTDGIHSLNGLQELYLQSFVYNELNNKIAESNVILIELINGTPESSTVGFIGDVKRVGYKEILVNLYKPTKLLFYGYSNLMSTVLFYLTNSANSIEKSINIEDGTLTDLSFSQTFKTIENINLTVSVGTSYLIEIIPSSSQISYPTGLVISLTAIGQSGKEWKYGTSYQMTFNNFDWIGNGWKDNYLVFNNGSYGYLNYDPCLLQEYTISFKYKTSGITQDETLISCVQGSLESGTGFRIDTNKVIILNSGNELEYEFDSTTEHEITIVSYNENYNNLSSIYIDGSILATFYKENLSKHSSYLPIEFKAENCNLHLKAINIFNKGLSAEEIISLYALNMEDPEAMFKYISDNNIFDINRKSLFLGDRVTISSIPIGSIYMVLESYKEDNEQVSLDPTPWKTINGYISNNPEEWKGIRHLLGSIKLIKKTADGSADPMNFYAKRATLSALGTSSMKYPWKNLRIYFKKTIDSSCSYYNLASITNNGKAGDFGYTEKMFYGVNPDGTGGVEGKATYQLFSNESYYDKNDTNKTGDFIKRTDSYTSAPAKLFCLKADFAESSGSHNTGFARLMHDLLNNSTAINYGNGTESDKLPQLVITEEAGSSKKWKYDIRSTVDGRPIYLFVKEAGQSDSLALYWGKFNMNNEKSSEDVFGFLGCADYYNNDIVKSEISTLERLFGGDSQGHLRLLHLKYTIKGGKYTDDLTGVSDDNIFYNPNECWEFSNNKFNLKDSVEQYTNIGAFLYPFTPNSTYPLYNLFGGRSPFTVKDSNGELAWLSLAWEYRFPGWETKEGKEDEAHIKYKNGTMVPKLLESLYKWIYKHNVTLYSETNKPSIMNEFARDLNKYFNINYLLKYYMATKWAANTDLRIKNCMLSFYCDPKVEINDNSEYPMGHMRAFYIFYDNDTILGLNNDGALKNPWNVGEEEYPGYNCHGVWEGLNYCYTYYILHKENPNIQPNIYKLGQLIEKAYQVMRKLDIAGDLRTLYFENDLVNSYPDMMFNIDAELKYYNPVRNLTLLNGTTQVDEPNRVECINGNRKFHRQNWWNKRTRWFDSKYDAGNNDKYGYSFKPSSAGGNEGAPTGSIKVTSALPEWRFYLTSANSKISNTSLLNQGESALLQIGNVSVSDHVNIISLYGCEELDFNGVSCKEYIGDLSSTGVFPYLKRFIFNEIDSINVKKLKASGLKNLINATTMPNLLELYFCGIESENTGKSFEKLNLADCSKLSIIDTRNTIINEIVLPNSSLLLKIYLQSPTILEVSNKLNVSTFEIIDSSNVNSITIGINNNTLVNSKLLSIINTNMNNSLFISSKNNILGDRSNSYHIDEELELPILIEIAEKVIGGNTKVMFNGAIHNLNITPEQQELLDRAFGENLLVSTDDSRPLDITYNKSELLEGEEITFFSTKYLNSENDWNVSYEGNEGTNTITYEEVRTKTSLKIKAPTMDDNVGRTHTLVVSLNGVSPIRIPIRYVAVTGLSISINDNLLNVNDYRNVNITYLPENTTKKHWAESKLNWVYTKGHMTGSTYYLDQAENDTLLAILNSTIKSNIIQILYNKELAKYESGKFTDLTESNKSSDSLSWISSLIAEYKGQNDLNGILTLKIHHLRNLQIDSTWISKLRTDIDIVYDFEWMKYVTYINNDTFIVPTIKFTNFGIPNVTKVAWDLNASDYIGYKTIEFNYNLLSAYLFISAPQILSGNTSDSIGFNLNFSNCNNIKKIYNKGKEFEDGTISLSITYPISISNSVTTLISGYPKNIEQIGNYLEVENIGEPLAMFNGTNTEGNILTSSSNAMNGYYKINLTPYSGKNVKVGNIYSYNISNGNNILEMSTPNTIIGTYYTFLNMNLLPVSDNSYNFENLTYIGQHTFGSDVSYEKNVTIKLHNPTFIGSDAFKFYAGILKTGTTDFELDLSAVTKINANAFIFVKHNLDVTLNSNNLISIGTDAFRNLESSEISHTIRIIGNGEFVYSPNSFGLDKSNSLYLSDEVYNWIQNTSNFDLLKNNVKIYVNNNLI